MNQYAYIGPNGYTLHKKYLTEQQISSFKRTLNFVPEVHGGPAAAKAAAAEKNVVCYAEGVHKFVVPHYYGVKNIGEPALPSKINDGKNTHNNLQFNGTLLERQVDVMNTLEQHLIDPKNLGLALVELHTGWGKTAGALYIATRIYAAKNQPTKKILIVVHTNALLNQWIERIHQFLPMAKVGIIQGSACEIDGCDIVIAMLQTVTGRNFPADTWTNFGFTIIDECHHIGSQHFSQLLMRVKTPYMLGLSATMDRNDGGLKVIEWFLGPIVAKVERKVGAQPVNIYPKCFVSDDLEYNQLMTNAMGELNMAGMMSKVCEHVPRTEFAIKELLNYISKNKDADSIINWSKENRLLQPQCANCLTPQFLVKTKCCNTISHCLPCLKRRNEEYIALHEAPENKTYTTILEPRKHFKKTLTPIVRGTVSNEEYYWAMHSGQYTEEVRVTYKKRLNVPCVNPQCKKRTQMLEYVQHYIDNPEVQPLEIIHTIVMCNMHAPLNFMYEYLVHNNLCSTGYYVGGMKPEDLKVSEKCQVILATYSMTSEGLDIPSLNTAMWLSQKSDVVQIIGRILRLIHKFTIPAVIAIIDKHDNFMKQWYKVRAYCRKQGYTVWPIEYAIADANADEAMDNDDDDGSDSDNVKTPAFDISSMSLLTHNIKSFN